MRAEYVWNHQAGGEQDSTRRWTTINEQIERLAEDTTELGILAEDAFKNAAAALYGAEADAAHIAASIAAENYQMCAQSRQVIHQQALNLLTHVDIQPEMMRRVVEIQRIASEFMRIAEAARALAGQALALGGRGDMYLRRAGDTVPHLFLQVVRQAYIEVRGCVIATTTHDTAIARRLISEDGELDRLFLVLKRTLENAIAADPSLAPAWHRILLIAVRLEEIGNRVTAICDTLLFAAS